MELTKIEMRRRENNRNALATKVWGYVRDHATSMVSETHTQWISDAIKGYADQCENEVDAIQRKLDAAEATIEMLTKEPPAVEKTSGWSKSKRLTEKRAVWAIEYVMGRGVPYALVARRLGVDPITISKLLRGDIWTDETAKVRAKYAKLDSQAESVQSR